MKIIKSAEHPADLLSFLDRKQNNSSFIPKIEDQLHQTSSLIHEKEKRNHAQAQKYKATLAQEIKKVRELSVTHIREAQVFLVECGSIEKQQRYLKFLKDVEEENEVRFRQIIRDREIINQEMSGHQRSREVEIHNKKLCNKLSELSISTPALVLNEGDKASKRRNIVQANH